MNRFIVNHLKSSSINGLRLLSSIFLIFSLSHRSDWQLRGSGNASDISQTIALTGNPGAIYQDLLKQLSRQNQFRSELDSDYILRLEKEQWKEATSTINDNLSEEEISVQVPFTILRGKKEIQSDIIMVTRLYQFDKNDIAAKESQARLVRADIQRNAVSQLLRRLSILEPVD